MPILHSWRATRHDWFWADASYAARLDLEENSLTRVKNVHIFNRLLELDTLVLKQQQPVSSGEVIDHAD